MKGSITMTTIEMLKEISENNWKTPKAADWKNAGLESASNFCLHLDKFWESYLKAQVSCVENPAESERYCEMAESRLTAAFNALEIHPNTAMMMRTWGLCQIKTVKDNVRYTSKTTFRKNALKYLLDCVNGNGALVEDEKLDKALNPKPAKRKDGFGWTVTTKLTPEQLAAFVSAMTPEQRKALLDAAKAA